LTGYFGARYNDLFWTLLPGCLVGIYDGTVGWKLSVILNANFGKYKEENLKMNSLSRIFAMLMFSLIFGYLGYIIERGYL
jgi:hypothetical protein